MPNDKFISLSVLFFVTEQRNRTETKTRCADGSYIDSSKICLYARDARDDMKGCRDSSHLTDCGMNFDNLSLRTAFPCRSHQQSSYQQLCKESMSWYRGYFSCSGRSLSSWLRQVSQFVLHRCFLAMWWPTWLSTRRRWEWMWFDELLSLQCHIKWKLVVYLWH